jgi:hypothetical protein
MREVRMTDSELQKLVAPALREHLKKAGFFTGASSIDHCGYFFPINIDLAGAVKITRHEDGTWTFMQEMDVELSQRTAKCEGMLIDACRRRAQPPDQEEDVACRSHPKARK